jgi:hypothetical protein
MRPLTTVLPAVTTTVQSTMLTGSLPRDHGIVANGWYFRDLSEIWLWRQSNRLVGRREGLGGREESAIRPSPAPSCSGGTTCTPTSTLQSPRPMYLADGRKTAGHPHAPGRPSRRTAGQPGRVSAVPLLGPGRRHRIEPVDRAQCAACARAPAPTLTLVYLPHLDYDLQRFGPHHPGIPAQVAAVDALCAPLIEKARAIGAHVVVLSEYGITEVSRPVHINRALRQAGWLKVRLERGREQLDAGASEAFAVADHQLAHVYVARPELVPEVAACLAALPGVEKVLDESRQAGRQVWTMRGRANWWQLPRPTAGSPTTTSLTTRVRRTSRARSTSIASRATTPSSSSSTANISFPKLAVARAWRARRWACAI